MPRDFLLLDLTSRVLIPSSCWRWFPYYSTVYSYAYWYSYVLKQYKSSLSVEISSSFKFLIMYTCHMLQRNDFTLRVSYQTPGLISCTQQHYFWLTLLFVILSKLGSDMISSYQGRDKGGQGGTIPQAPNHYYGGRRMTAAALKSPSNVTITFFNTVHLLPKDLKFEHGGAKFASCPGRHLISLRPCVLPKFEREYKFRPLAKGVYLRFDTRWHIGV